MRWRKWTGRSPGMRWGGWRARRSFGGGEFNGEEFTAVGGNGEDGVVLGRLGFNWGGESTKKRAADVLDKVAREEMLSGHGGASLCSGGALGFLRKSPETKGESVREGEEWKGAPRAFSWRREGDVEALGQAGGGSPRRHARHASARRQRLKTPLPLAGWAGFGGQLGQVGRR